MSRGEVYFIRAKETNRVKVGFSISAIARLAQLQTGSSSLLILEHCFSVKDTRHSEAVIHGDLRRFRLHGEWFEISSDDLLEYIEVFKEVRLPDMS